MNALTPVRPGDIVAGKYRVDRILGQGGMGVVVAATHVDLQETRALKFLLPTALPNGEALERFLREARAASRLKSEHVARVHDVGKLEDGAPYMVMEYLEGYDLGAAIKHYGAIPLETAIFYVLQAMEALAEAHAAGIIHRDLKPANLFLTVLPDGVPCIKVLDFGISKIIGAEAQDIDVTKTHAVLGSPQFMAPEQMRSSRDVDVRSDIWSLGVILYQMATGRIPFRGRNVTEIVAVVLSGPPAPPSSLAPHLPPAFDALVMKCLRRDPDDRFSNVAELATALAPLAPPAAAYMLDRIARVSASFAKKSGGALPMPPPSSVPGFTPSPYVTNAAFPVPPAPSSVPGVTPNPYSTAMTTSAVPTLDARTTPNPYGSIPPNLPTMSSPPPVSTAPLPMPTLSAMQAPGFAQPGMVPTMTGAWGGTQATTRAPTNKLVYALAGLIALLLVILIVLQLRPAAAPLSASPAISAAPTIPVPATNVSAAPVVTVSTAPVATTSAAPEIAPSASAKKKVVWDDGDPFGTERK